MHIQTLKVNSRFALFLILAALVLTIPCTSPIDSLPPQSNYTPAPLPPDTLPPAPSAEILKSLPLYAISQLRYKGAFRIIADKRYGESTCSFAEGTIEYNPANHSIFLVGHAPDQAIAEYAVPALSLSDSLDSLSITPPPLQLYSKVLNRAQTANPENVNIIGGLHLAKTSQGINLFATCYIQYDANGAGKHSLLNITNPNSLADSPVKGFYILEGGPGHVAGWISPLPPELQALFGGSCIAGNSSGMSIISRTSVGPAAFAFNEEDVIAHSDHATPIRTVRLLDFDNDEAKRLHPDLLNQTNTNDLWTQLAQVEYGFIIPGTRSYLTIGRMGGLTSDICYKCEQDNGRLCPGYCAQAAEDDNYHYYWLWDINDFMLVKEGKINSYTPRPYAYGKLRVSPLIPGSARIGGGSFDPQSGDLYVSFRDADKGYKFSQPPLIAVFSVGN